MNRKERQEARADRYRELAQKATYQSTQAFNQSHKMVENIPFGQPILVGHHSERSHRNLLDRSWNTMGKSVALSDKANYYLRKSEAAEKNSSIYLGDDDAVERLEEKLCDLGKGQERMKAANKIIRSAKLSEKEKIEKLIELGFSEKAAKELFVPDCFRNIGFASFTITNNGANIRRVKLQLEKAKKMKSTEDKEYYIGEVKVIENYKENRLQLFFPDIPPKEIRTKLSDNSFRWSRFNGCWQSYIHNYLINIAKNIITIYSQERQSSESIQ